MIKIILITGFLGSGKTSLCKNIAFENSKNKNNTKNILFLINEFANANVDCVELNQKGEKTINIKGGSIFCSCKLEQMIAYLQEIPILYKGNLPEFLIIEASGSSNSSTLFDLIKLANVSSQYEIINTICLINAQNFLSLKKVFLSINDQIKSSNFILINKCDLASDEDLLEINKNILSLNKNAKTVQTSFAKINFNWQKKLYKNCNNLLCIEEEEKKEKASSFSSCIIDEATNINEKVLINFLEENSAIIWRAKGYFINEKKEIKYLDYSQNEIKISPSNTKNIKPCIALIFDGKNEIDIRKKIKKTFL